MENTLTIILVNPPYRQTWLTLKFREVFPECIWSEACGMDGHDVTLMVEQPIITPTVLKLMDFIIRRGYHALGYLPNDINYLAVDRYLNVPIFRSMAQPKFKYYWRWFRMKVLVNIPMSTAQYEEILALTLQHKTMVLVEFIWPKIPRDAHSPLELTYLLKAVESQYIDLCSGLLHRGVSPLMPEAKTKITPLEMAIRKGVIVAGEMQSTFIEMMLPYISPMSLVQLVPEVPSTIMHYLISHPNLQEDHMEAMVQEMTYKQQWAVIWKILHHPKITRRAVQHLDLGYCLRTGHEVKAFLDSSLAQADDLGVILADAVLEERFDVMVVLAQNKWCTANMERIIQRALYAHPTGLTFHASIMHEKKNFGETQAGIDELNWASIKEFLSRPDITPLDLGLILSKALLMNDLRGMNVLEADDRCPEALHKLLERIIAQRREEALFRSRISGSTY